MPAPSRNGNTSPVASGSKLSLPTSAYSSTVGSSQHVSAIQHVPPTHHYSVNGSLLQDNTNTLVSSSTSNSADVPEGPVNYRDDIGLDDKELVTISTKELNRMLKKKGIGKSRQKEIKCERRTLKNRGYASNCRISREDEEKRLEKDNVKLEDEIKKSPPLEHLQQEYLQLRNGKFIFRF